MAVTFTENGTNTPNGTHKEFSYTFATIKTDGTDVKVALDGVTQATNRYTVNTGSSPTKITFNNTNGVDSAVQESDGAPKTGVKVRVYRDTLLEDADTVTFVAGSSIRASDLNANFNQARYALQEEQSIPIDAEDIQDGAITSAKILDGTIATADIADNAINADKIADDAVNGNHIDNGSVTAVKIASNAVTTAKIVNDAVTADKIADTSVTPGSYTATNITVDAQGRITSAASGTIANIISDGDITTAKLADDAVTADKLANSINAEIAANTAKNTNVTTNLTTSTTTTAVTVNSSDGTNATIGEATGSAIE